MKYTLNGFSQRYAIELGLDLIDLSILRWFVDFKDSGKMVSKIINDEKYYWVSYEKIVQELPILNLQKDAAYRRLKKMCEKNILKKETVYSKGVYSYYTTAQNYIYLISDTSLFIKGQGVDSSDQNPSSSALAPNPLDQNPSSSVQKPEQNINLSNSSTKKNNLFVETSNEYRLSQFLYEKIKVNSPNAKKPNFQSWSKCFNYMIRLDKRGVDEITGLIEWVHQPNNFWSCQILSPKNLRKHYDRLMMTKRYELNRGYKGNNYCDFEDIEQE